MASKYMTQADPPAPTFFTDLVVVGMKEYGVSLHGSQSLNNHLRTSYIGVQPPMPAPRAWSATAMNRASTSGSGADFVTLFNNKLIGCSDDYGVAVLGVDTAETTILFATSLAARAANKQTAAPASTSRTPRTPA